MKVGSSGQPLDLLQFPLLLLEVIEAAGHTKGDPQPGGGRACSVSPQMQTSVAWGPHEVEGRRPSLQPHGGAWFATHCGFGSQDADTDSRGEQLWPGFRGQGQEGRGWLQRWYTFNLSLLRCQARCRLSLESSYERKLFGLGRLCFSLTPLRDLSCWRLGFAQGHK